MSRYKGRGQTALIRTGVLLTALTLTACGGGADSRTVPGGKATFSRDGNQVTGSVGSAWSDAELASNAYGVLCGPGETVSDLAIQRRPDGSASVSATCL